MPRVAASVLSIALAQHPLPLEAAGRAHVWQRWHHRSQRRSRRGLGAAAQTQHALPLRAGARPAVACGREGGEGKAVVSRAPGGNTKGTTQQVCTVAP